VDAGKLAFGPEWSPDRVAIAPARIELLGNHVDYNGGPVLAAAIDRFIAVAIATDTGKGELLRGVALDAPRLSVTEINAAALAGWQNDTSPPAPFDYARGLLAALIDRSRSTGDSGPALPASLAIAGDIPIGFGVSSSAALCVALALALAKRVVTPEELVLIAQEAEHRAGTPCGTMDQSASVAGGVIAFDGATLAVDRLAPALGDLVFVVAASGVDRALGASSYPTRVAESREALELANAALGINLPYLASLSASQLSRLTELRALPEPLLSRARHVVEECARVRVGREAMVAGDWQRFGALMTESGHSSATLYEISHPAVEELVAEALQVEGVLGGRMMGGGEGGVALILLPAPRVSSLEATLRNTYYRRHSMDDQQGLLHVCSFAPGAALVPGESVVKDALQQG
jgi:galactokinase